MSTSRNRTSIVLVDGCRIPFQKPGTGYRRYRAHDLARFAIRGLLDRTGLDPGKIDRVVMGNVIQDPETANLAREAALGAGLPASVPAQTVSMSCLSGHLAVTTAAETILSGQADVVIAGGADSASAWLERFPLKKHRALPFLKEFSTGETMGEYADRLAAQFGVTREAQDAYTVRSHQSAVRAFREELHESDIVPVSGPPDFVPIIKDNLVRPDTTLESLSLFSPVFNRKYGTVTAANGSIYADGAAAVLLMSEEKADELGLKPIARLSSWVYTAGNPKEEMLMGQVSAISSLLERAGATAAAGGTGTSGKDASGTGTGSGAGDKNSGGTGSGGKRLTPDDIDVFELQETFAAQIIAVLEAAASGELAGGRGKAASIPLKKLNTLGGTLAMGHVFGATGIRLMVTAANRLAREKGRFALAAGCAGGGLGHAMLLEPADAHRTASRPAKKAAKSRKDTAAPKKSKPKSQAK